MVASGGWEELRKAEEKNQNAPMYIKLLGYPFLLYFIIIFFLTWLMYFYNIKLLGLKRADSRLLRHLNLKTLLNIYQEWETLS